MANLGSIQIKVDPDKMRQQADEVRRLGNAMRQEFASLASVMDRTSYYWIGDAGDLHRKLYNDGKDDIQDMLGRLLEHPDDLEQIAGNYTAGERANVNTAQSLPGDALS